LLNYHSNLVWGFAASVVLLTTTIAGQSLGLTRIDIPFILGTMFTANRDRAKVLGVAMHIANGWLFALVFGFFFESIELATWWFGAIIGAVQGIFVVVVLLPILPGIHPRMVSDYRGPEPTRLLEPPGFLASNYGRWTPVVIIIAHTLYGLLLGMFYLPR
jgi:hypothetical protein